MIVWINKISKIKNFINESWKTNFIMASLRCLATDNSWSLFHMVGVAYIPSKQVLCYFSQYQRLSSLVRLINRWAGFQNRFESDGFASSGLQNPASLCRRVCYRNRPSVGIIICGRHLWSRCPWKNYSMFRV